MLNLTCFVGLLDLLDLSVATATEDLDETLLVSSSTLDCPVGRREGGREGGREEGGREGGRREGWREGGRREGWREGGGRDGGRDVEGGQ